MKDHPFHIRLIAGTYFAASALAVLHDLWGANRLVSPAKPEIVVVMSLDLFPALLGLLLIQGKRWVRWLFIPLIPLVAAIALLISFGNAMRTVPKATPETVWFWIFFLITVVSTVAVFHYFADEAEGPTVPSTCSQEPTRPAGHSPPDTSLERSREG